MTCQQCDQPRLPGVPYCQYHWNEVHWGKAWADRCQQLLLQEEEQESQFRKPLVLSKGLLRRDS